MEAATTEATWQGLEECREGLRAFLRRHTRDDSEIDDVVQETFVRAARHRARHRGPRRLSAWVTRIAMNVLADARRRERRWLGEDQAPGALEGAAMPAAEAPTATLRLGSWVLERDAALRHLSDALGGLRVEDRRVLGSFYGGEGSCRRTARECGIPLQLVKVRLFRARKRLLRSLRQRLALLSDGAERADGERADAAERAS